MDPLRRRELAAHYTPPDLAARMVHLALTVLHGGDSGPPKSGAAHRETASSVPGATLPVVCDPSCGEGSVLLAAADALVDQGADPSEVLAGHLVGFEIDSASASVARGSLMAWAVSHGVESPRPMVVQADAMQLPLGRASFDLVVGNPPFASPLSSGVTKPGSGGIGGAYVDHSAVHLLAAVRATRAGGVTCLLQPQSLLGARDSAALRDELDALATLEALWASDADLFEHAAVRVCAPVLRRRAPGVPAGRESSTGGSATPPGPATASSRRSMVATVWRDGAVRRLRDPGPGAWSSLLAAMSGAPVVGRPPDAVALSTVARCTAGFRDEFYELAAVAREATRSEEKAVHAGSAPSDADHVLVSSGMIDPATSRWGDGTWRIAGASYRGPLADTAELQRRHARVASWASGRRVPKVMVASQTRVIEAVADPLGRCVPLTPVVSVEPVSGWPAEALAAMLSSPSNSALVWSMAAGTGRNSTALRISAPNLGHALVNPSPSSLALACDLYHDLEGMATQRAGVRRWAELGVKLDQLVGFDGDPAVARWWAERLPRRIVSA